MGHDFNIHVKHYAMQTELLERAKVAKVLVAINSGKIAKPQASTSVDTCAGHITETQLLSEDGLYELSYASVDRLAHCIVNFQQKSWQNWFIEAGDTDVDDVGTDEETENVVANNKVTSGKQLSSTH
jgi:Glu-tRNA(Gln) amidotransferase subunit E-like FAD-binding protein